jgi:predicted ATPase
MKPKRIMLYGGPGAGKSTMAHYLMWRIKDAGVQVDLAREVIKREAFAKANLDPMVDQLRVMGQQVAEEQAAINTGYTIISDSPILLQGAYAGSANLRATSIEVAQRLDDFYPAIHIFVNRDDAHFKQEGRWQTLEQARQKDWEILRLLQEARFDFNMANYGDWEGLWTLVR